MSGVHSTLFDEHDQQKGQMAAGKKTASGKLISSVWTFPGSGGGQLYRWYGTLRRALLQGPIGLYVDEPTKSVLDPFMGTGTTLSVAADLDLFGIGIDANPLACLIAATRLDRKSV